MEQGPQPTPPPQNPNSSSASAGPSPSAAAAAPASAALPTAVQEPNAIHADVVAEVVVGAKGDLAISLAIMTKNSSAKAIHLEEPYEIQVKNAQDPKATAYFLNAAGGKTEVRTAATATKNTQGAEAVRIAFTEKPAWKPGDTLQMKLNFKAPGLFKVEKETLFGPYLIVPVDEYQGVHIASHTFDYKFVFKTPAPTKLDEIVAWPFKINDVKESNSRSNKPKRKRRPWRTTMRYSFSAANHDNMKITFSSEYKYWTLLSATVSFATGFILEFALHDTLHGYLEKAKAFLEQYVK
jgi:hypothetical protein